MKRRFATELAAGARVNDAFVLASKEMRATRSGEAYLVLELADRSGRIPAVYFRPSPEAIAAPVGSVVSVGGAITVFRGSKRISVESLGPAVSYVSEELMPASDRDTGELVDELRSLVGRVSDTPLRRVLSGVFGDQSFFAKFTKCPASHSEHHAYAGGLLEHTVAVASLCASLAERYPEADGDMLLTAALLHDVGKVEAMEFGLTIAPTESGRLVGHVVLGVQHVARVVGKSSPRLERSHAARLEHALLAHHGESERGSGRPPATLEAMLLHYADDLDAKAAGFVTATSRALKVEESWTNADNPFARPLYAPRPDAEQRRRTGSEQAEREERRSA